MSKNTRPWFEPERLLKNYLFWTHLMAFILGALLVALVR